MKEPLNLATAIGTTSNNWPAWHNQPLHLTVAEIDNPALVLDQFFDCYLLQDIRTCLQNWLQDALAKSTMESKEHVNTHNEVQKLVEAAWLIRQNGSENRLQQPAHKEDDAIIEEKFNKPKRLIEKAVDDPLHVIQEVFKAESLIFFKEAMRDWLHVGLTSESIKYQFAGQRSCLLDFYNQLLLLVEALYILNDQQRNKKISTTDNDATELLIEEQIGNPLSVVVDFFERFPMAYVQRELYDWFYAAIAFSGTWPDDLCPEKVFDVYEYLSCLTEAALMLSQVSPSRLEGSGAGKAQEIRITIFDKLKVAP